jgi:uncharacterized protein
MPDSLHGDNRLAKRASLIQENWVSRASQGQLLAIARSAIEGELSSRLAADPAAEADELGTASLGAFVSLYRGRSLRGCMGNCFPQKRLHETVKEVAVSAAFKDRRFTPLTPDELPRVTIEISVLSPLRDLGHPLEVEVGRHGLYIIGGNQHGVLLPQVAVEQGWDKLAFLEAACMKAGLMASSWEMIGTRVLVFTAQVISEVNESISQ